MGLARIWGYALAGLEAVPVRVEAHVRPGLPGITVVGLPDAAVREAKERVRSAAANSGFPLPSQRITLSLSPGDLRKEGPGFDVPLALATLAAGGHLPLGCIDTVGAAGELGLDGALLGIRGALAIAKTAAAQGITGLLVPAAVAPEAWQWGGGLKVWGVRTLAEAVSVLRSPEVAAHVERRTLRFSQRARARAGSSTAERLDMSQVAGAGQAKRGLEIAAVGGHHMLMLGSPGSGKTMLARRFPSILPELTLEESLEVTRIWSVCGLHPPGDALLRARPFRAPHHTASAPALVGGGSFPRPGEVTLAHRGVLFLDELPEFARDALEALRQPLEEGVVTIGRRNATLNFPARFRLIAAMNPCPCGHYGHPERECTCTAAAIAAYGGRISGPLLDRIDMVIGVHPLREGFLEQGLVEDTSASVRVRVEAAVAFRTWREQQLRAAEPARGAAGRAESALVAMAAHYRLSGRARSLLAAFQARAAAGARAVSRAMRLARTIADLVQSEEVAEEHLAEALVLRNRDHLHRDRW